MAVFPLGIITPAPVAPTATPATTARHALRLVPVTSRTRRCHGVFILGDRLACIYSTRRSTSAHGVTVELGHGDQPVPVSLTPPQARAVARALLTAADAAEAVQRAVKGGAA